jgi:proline racemase
MPVPACDPVFQARSWTHSYFKGRVEAAAAAAERYAITLSVAGGARRTGRDTFPIDDRDPLALGFVVK